MNQLFKWRKKASAKASFCPHNTHHCQLPDTFLHTEAIVELCRVLSMPHRVSRTLRCIPSFNPLRSETFTNINTVKVLRPSSTLSAMKRLPPCLAACLELWSWEDVTVTYTRTNGFPSHSVTFPGDEATAPVRYRKRNLSLPICLLDCRSKSSRISPTPTVQVSLINFLLPLIVV